MNDLLYSPRELGVRKFGFDIGDIVYYHYTGQVEDVESDRFSRGYIRTPADVPLTISTHFLVLDFSFYQFDIEKANVDVFNDNVYVIVQQITSGKIFHLRTSRRTFIKRRKVRVEEVSRVTGEMVMVYKDDEKDKGEELLTFKVFKVSAEDQRAFERVMSLTSWFMDSRDTIKRLKNEINNK